MDQLNTKDSYFNLKQVLLSVLSHWYWIVACILIGLGIAFLINHYSQPDYMVTTTLLVNKTSDEIDPMTLLFSGRQVTQEGMSSERVIFSSFPVVGAALSELNNTVSYFFGNRLKLIELYKNSPIQVSILPDSKSAPYGKLWKVYPKDTIQFVLKTDNSEYPLTFGKPYEVNDFRFQVDVVNTKTLLIYDFIAFRLNSLFTEIATYRDRIQISSPAENIINVSFTHKNTQKAKDFLNILADKVIERSREQKSNSFERTIAFIDEQIKENYDSLQIIEGEIKRFKNEKVAVDPLAEQSRVYGNITSWEEEQANIALSNEYYDYLLNTIESNEGLDNIVIPSSVGIEDGILDGLVNRLINLQMDVKLLREEKKFKNPLLLENQELIEELKANIRNNIQNQKRNNQIRYQDINRRVGVSRARLQELPQAEQELTNIQRTYNLNENLYLLLLQKKMEAGIQASAVSPDYAVINRAYDNGIVSSDPKRNYLVSVLLGLVFPVGLILILDFFDVRIKSKEEATQIAPFPVLGSIEHLEDPDERYHIASAFMESFRSLRANLHYLGLGNNANVMMTTSSMSGEGKSFCSHNLAYTLSLTHDKVLWIDADMRKIGNQNHLQIQQKTGSDVDEMDDEDRLLVQPEEKGLSDYLAGMIEEPPVISADKPGKFWTIRSGQLPPNPAELLVSPRMKTLIQQQREQFDYVIIDTPPIGIFADASELLPLVDHTLLIIRHKFSRSTFLKHAVEVLSQRQLRNVSVIYNDVRTKHGKYGQEYMYSNGQDKPKKARKKKALLNFKFL